MTHIISVANQKGGVGKTTTAVNLAAALARFGHNVTLIDLDPQGNASTGLGVEAQSRNITSYDLLAGETTLEKAAHDTKIPGLKIVPATPDLSSADIDLSNSAGRTRLLKRSLPTLNANDFILIDCPPALGLLTVNAMVAATSLLVPLQTEFYALEGLSQLLNTVRQVRETANPKLRINGVVLTMVDGRNNLSQQVEADARATLGDLVYETVIPRNVRVSEAPSFAMPVLDYDSHSKGAQAYHAFSREFLVRLKAQ